MFERRTSLLCWTCSYARCFLYVQIQALVHKQSTIAAPNPVTPRMLPSVHLAWAPLVSALQDWRIPVVEVALKFLADCVCLSGKSCIIWGLCVLGIGWLHANKNVFVFATGSFLRKRFHDETMPVVQRLLKDGPTQRNIIAPGACLLYPVPIMFHTPSHRPRFLSRARCEPYPCHCATSPTCCP